jgi:protein SCO1/2
MGVKRLPKAKVIVPLLLLALAAIAAAGFQLFPRQPAIPAYLQQMGGDFALTASKGTVHLSDYRGKVVLVYFGYTHCPDVCPMALGTIAAAMHELDSEHGKEIRGIFVSVDPRRDTPEKLQQYAAFFDPRIIGATGTPEQLKKIAAKWRVDFKVPDMPADANYEVEHTPFIYLVTPDGQIAALFDEKTDPKEIAAAARQWLP